jgi:hypothetical protein
MAGSISLCLEFGTQVVKIISHKLKVPTAEGRMRVGVEQFVQVFIAFGVSLGYAKSIDQ